jgi:hypothetical protein
VNNSKEDVGMLCPVKICLRLPFKTVTCAYDEDYIPKVFLSFTLYLEDLMRGWVVAQWWSCLARGRPWVQSLSQKEGRKKGQERKKEGKEGGREGR